ncbi:MAG: tRNA (N(6)-L-threonylcarbamoyladenosine(37)-C(2))-methylthiotransferase MtaB, partial [Alphaproteobacteria bacterium]|nr:tRNA (N(6)-L-threonylcarbamoyladenosine(37)-C(2))-methylthiotransferase MtaB [Alphaproteobacteria bacterium]
MTIEVINFGCRLNAFEAELMRRRAAEAGLAEAVLLNTCAVTNEAVRQARQAIRKARRERPGARIVVAGCAAQLAAHRFADMPEVDRVLGNAEKLKSESYRDQAPRLAVGDILTAAPAMQAADGPTERARGFVAVQQGCDHRCTFCVIPFARGPSRSLPPERVVAAVGRLVAAGKSEAVLTGVDLTAYGQDLAGRPRLGQLVRRILGEVPELPRLRLSSLDPAEIDEELFAAFAEAPRLMPHVHLSLQAADDLILKRMRRRHSRAGALAVVRRLAAARPGIAFGADLIAGFPTEDEAAFARTLDFVTEAELAFLHVFPFSPRAGTPAARMPAVPGAAVRERAARLR